MINSILILGGSHKTRMGKALEIKAQMHVSDFDFVGFEAEKSIGIDLIRQLKDKLSRRPFQSQYIIAFIPQAEKLTIAAQNALLKILEEGGETNIIVLSAPFRHAFLPTVLSRCQIINLPPVGSIKSTSEVDLIASFIGKSDAEKLLLAAPFYKREEAIGLMKNILSSYQARLVKNPDAKTAEMAQKAATALESLEQNANPRLVISNLVLDL